MKILKRFFQFLLLIILLLVAGLYLTGNGYLIKGVRCTYLRGETSATIDDYQFFSHRRIDSGEEMPWPEASDYNEMTLSTKLLTTLEEYRSVAFLIIQDDSIRQEHYWDGYGKLSLSNSFSMAKSIISMLAFKAIEEGAIKGLHQKVVDFIPELKGPFAQELEIWHLLRMCSGLQWVEHYTSPFSVTAEAYYTRSLEKLILDQPIVNKPGSFYKYQSGNTQLMAVVLARATKMSVGAYASEKLWKPLGASSPAIWSLDHESGVEKAYCCFNSNARDFARFGQLYLDSGIFHGTQIIDTSWVVETTRPTVTENGVTNFYGLSWWLVNEFDTPVYYMRGILGQYVIVIPELDLVAVRLGHKRAVQVLNDHPIDLVTYVDELIKLYRR